MLDNLRDFAKTWVGKVIGAFLLVGLAGFGISGVLTGFGNNNVASVGGEDISIRDFQQAYNAQLNAVAARIGVVPTAEQALQFGIPSSVINQLASNAALDAMGREFGLGVSDDRLSGMLRDDPNFGGTLGNFERDNFRRLLQQNGITEKEYFDTQKKSSRRQQIALGIFSGAKAPETALKLINRYTADTRIIDYFVVRGESLLPPADPTDAEVVTYLTDNQARFRTVPTRTATFMVLSPAAIAAGIEISDDEVAAEYERTKANYVKIETRQVRQVNLPSETLDGVFEQAIIAGKTFDEIIAETGLPVTDLGVLTKEQITDNILSEAAFELAEGEYKLIVGAQGSRAVTISDIVPGGQSPLSEVSDDIAERLKTRQARDMYVDILDQIEEFRAAFKPISEIAERYNLDLTEIPLTSSGEALEAIEIIPADGRTRVSGAVFSAKEDALAPTVALGANLNVWFDLLAIDPARDQALDEIKDDLIAEILAERTDDALQEKVEELVAELAKGEDFATLALAGQYSPQQSDSIGRNGRDANLNPGVLAEAFRGDTGHFGSARNADGNYVVFKVGDITQAPEEGIEATREFVQGAVLDSVYAEFIGGLRDEKGLRINNQVLSQLLAIDSVGSQ